MVCEVAFVPPLAIASVPVVSEIAIPKEEVAICWYEPPAYEPRRTPAAVGLEMPVPPPPAVNVPDCEGEKVMVEPEPEMASEDVMPFAVELVVANVRVPVKEPCGRTIEVALPPAEIQEPFIAKQPPVRLMPLPVEKVEVAAVKLMPFVFPIESSEPGDVVPMPTFPEKYEVVLFGSNQYFAVVVAEPPMVTMSVELFE